jgi:hypothetical protein
VSGSALNRDLVCVMGIFVADLAFLTPRSL